MCLYVVWYGNFAYVIGIKEDIVLYLGQCCTKKYRFQLRTVGKCFTTEPVEVACYYCRAKRCATFETFFSYNLAFYVNGFQFLIGAKGIVSDGRDDTGRPYCLGILCGKGIFISSKLRFWECQASCVLVVESFVPFLLLFFLSPLSLFLY